MSQSGGEVHEGAGIELALGAVKSRELLERVGWGTLFALRRKKPEMRKGTLLAALADIVQLIPFAVSADFSWDALTVERLQIVNRLQLVGNLAVGGYGVFTTVFWTLIAFLLLTCLLMVWVGVSVLRSHFNSMWQLRLARRLLLILAGGGFISALNVLLTPYRCAYRTSITYATATLIEFPGVMCWGSGNAVLAAVGGLFVFILLLLAFASIAVLYEPDHRTKQVGANANLAASLQLMLLRALLVLASVVLAQVQLWHSLAKAAIFIALCLVTHVHPNAYGYWMNVFRAGSFGGLAAAACLQVVVEFVHRPSLSFWPYVAAVVVPSSVLLSAILMARELNLLRGTHARITRMNPSGVEYVVVHRFEEASHVEISARFLRYGPVDGNGLEIAGAVWLAGMAQFPDNVDLVVGYANHLLSYTNDTTKATHLLDRARRMRPPFLTRYVLFIREQEHAQRRAKSSYGDTSMDLATYVEFQAQFKMVIRAHRRVLREVRRFWKLVHAMNLNDDVLRQMLIKVNANAHNSSMRGSFGKHMSSGIRSAISRTLSRNSRVEASPAPTPNPGISSTGGHSHSHSRARRQQQGFLRSAARHLSGGGDDEDSDSGRQRSPALRRVSLTGEKARSPIFHGHQISTAGFTITRQSAVSRVSRVCLAIDRLAGEAQRSYEALLEKYPRSSKLLRSFARFHLEINQNQREADRFLAEAERVDEGAGADDGGNTGALDREGQLKATSLVDDSVDALVVIDSRGTIQSVNSNVRRMFGYSESELVGKNVSMLMPPHFSVQHDTFIHNYITTGQAKVLGRVRRLEGRRKDGSVFPLDLAVNRIDTPSGITFAGVIHALKEDDTVAQVTINDTGVITTCNRAFTRMFGWPLSECIGKNIKVFMPRKFAKHHDSYLQRYKRTGKSSAVGVAGRRMQGLHRNGATFPISVEIEVSAAGRTNVYHAKITELNNAAGVLTIDDRGIVQSVNKSALIIFGYSAQNDLVGRNVNKLMAEPYASFHNSYLQRFAKEGRGRIVGGKGRYVTAKHSDGTLFPIFLRVTEVKGKDKKRLFAADIALASAAAQAQSEGQADAVFDAGGDDDIAAGAEAHGNDSAQTQELDPLLGRVSINAEGKILFVNHVVVRMFGFENASELRNRNVNCLMPPNVAKQHDEYLRRHRETGVNHIIGSVSRHLMAQHKDGFLFPVSLAVEEESVGGQVTYHGQMRALGEIEGILFADLHGRILSVNQGVCFLFGHRERDLEGRNLRKLMPQPFRKEHDGYLKKYRETGEVRFTGKRQIVPALHADGSRIPIQVEVAHLAKHAQYGECLAARIVAAAVTADEAEAWVSNTLTTVNMTEEQRKAATREALAGGTSSGSDTDKQQPSGSKRAQSEPPPATAVRKGKGGVGFAVSSPPPSSSPSGGGGGGQPNESSAATPSGSPSATASATGPEGRSRQNSLTLHPHGHGHGHGHHRSSSAPGRKHSAGDEAAMGASGTPRATGGGGGGGGANSHGDDDDSVFVEAEVGSAQDQDAEADGASVDSGSGAAAGSALYTAGGSALYGSMDSHGRERTTTGGAGAGGGGGDRDRDRDRVTSKHSAEESVEAATMPLPSARVARHKQPGKAPPELKGDNRYIYSDYSGNAISFLRASELLGFRRPELEPGGSGDGPDIRDAHMENKHNGWMGMFQWAMHGYQLPGRDYEKPAKPAAPLPSPSPQMAQRRQPPSAHDFQRQISTSDSNLLLGTPQVDNNSSFTASFSPPGRVSKAQSSGSAAMLAREMSRDRDRDRDSPSGPPGFRTPRNPAGIPEGNENEDEDGGAGGGGRYPPVPSGHPSVPRGMGIGGCPVFRRPSGSASGGAPFQSSFTIGMNGVTPDAGGAGGPQQSPRGMGEDGDGMQQVDVLSEAESGERAGGGGGGDEDVLYDEQDNEAEEVEEEEQHGGGKHDDSDGRSEASGTSGMGMTAVQRRRSKHRMRQLRRIRRNQAIRKTVAKMTWWTALVTGATMAALTVTFAVSQSLVTELVNQVEMVAAAGNRGEAVQWIAYSARALQLAAAANDTTSYARASAMLHTGADMLGDMHRGLYLGFDQVRELTDPLLKAHYEIPSIEATVYLDTAEPPVNDLQLMSWWDLANRYATAATLLVQPDGGSGGVGGVGSGVGGVGSGGIPFLDPLMDPNTFNDPATATATSSSSSSGSTAVSSVNVTIRDTVPWRFLMDNAGLTLAHAIASAELHLAYVDAVAESLAIFQLIVLVGEIVVPALLLFVVVRPMYRKLLSERAAMFSLFSVIPRKMTDELAQMRITLGHVRDDEASTVTDSDDSDDSEGEEEDELLDAQALGLLDPSIADGGHAGAGAGAGAARKDGLSASSSKSSMQTGTARHADAHSGLVSPTGQDGGFGGAVSALMSANKAAAAAAAAGGGGPQYVHIQTSSASGGSYLNPNALASPDIMLSPGALLSPTPVKGGPGTGTGAWGGSPGSPPIAWAGVSTGPGGEQHGTPVPNSGALFFSPGGASASGAMADQRGSMFSVSSATSTAAHGLLVSSLLPGGGGGSGADSSGNGNGTDVASVSLAAARAALSARMSVGAAAPQMTSPASAAVYGGGGHGGGHGGPGLTSMADVTGIEGEPKSSSASSCCKCSCRRRGPSAAAAAAAEQEADDSQYSHGHHQHQHHRHRGRCCTAVCDAFTAFIAIITYPFRYVLWLLLRATQFLVSVFGPLFSLKRPVSMPRKVGYSALLLVSLIILNYFVSSDRLQVARNDMYNMHAASRRGALSTRVAALAQELVYARSAWIEGLDPSPPPAPSSLSTSPDTTVLRNAIRATVTAAQRTHEALVYGARVLAPVEEAEGAGVGAFGQSSSLPIPAAELRDHGDRAILAVGLQVSELLRDAVPAPAVGNLDRLSGSLTSALKSSEILFRSDCTREAGFMIASKYVAAVLEQQRANVTRMLAATVSTAAVMADASALVTSASLASASEWEWPLGSILPVGHPAECLAPTSIDYPYVSDGLDTSFRAMLQRAWLLANDTDASLVPSNPRYAFIVSVATLDVDGGNAASKEAYAADASSALNSIHLSETLLYLSYLGVIFTWYVVLFRPYMAQIAQESGRVAALLAFLPKSVDLQKLIRVHQAHTQRQRADLAALQNERHEGF